jgi:glycosyltransferase involved in cell wall biosynthesis
VDVERIPVSRGSDGYWLAGGRLVGYKRFDLVVKAFAKLNLPLKVFGTGPEEKKLRGMAGKNTRFLGYVDDAQKIRLLGGAIGFVHPQLEDFGIAAVEAMAAGKPVIAFGKGGAAETVLDGATGIHLQQQTWEAIGDAVIRFDPSRFDADTIRKRAEEFSLTRFAASLDEAIAQTLERP